MKHFRPPPSDPNLENGGPTLFDLFCLAMAAVVIGLCVYLSTLACGLK